MFPYVRLRRTRSSPWLRELLAENSISASDLILPIFITEGNNIREPIKSMPDVFRLSIDEAEKTIKEAASLGINAVALFPCVSDDLKSSNGDEAYNLDNLICRCIRHIKNANIDIGIICDVALDPYTTHGHDGVLKGKIVDNDKTLESLQNQALVLAKAGADIIAPSDMMDGRIQAIREILEENDFGHIPIIAYAAKYASNFYGPFRDAVGSKNCLKSDKKTYQMDYRNSKEALREIELDVLEGADMVMIKPGMPYLDVIKEASQNFLLPVLAYQVSGEYAMLKFAAQNGALDFDKTLMESLLCFKRAGAKAIFTYGAIEAARILG